MKIRNKIIIITIISIISILFVYNDYFLYKTPILKITSIKNEIKENKISKEVYYNQTIIGTIKNGKYKNNQVTTTNTKSTSGVYDEQIHKNSELFIQISKDGKEVVSIKGIKRDKYIVILFLVFIDLIVLISPKKGIKTILSLIVNIIISAISILTFQKYYKTINLLSLYLIVSILFIILSLYITNRKSKKTLSAIISSIVSLFISFSFSFLIIKLYGNDITIWSIEYIEVVKDYENYFYVSVLLSGLGAIMDIAITLSSSLNELIIKNPKITRKNLIKSGREISKDIIGTMTNVMLYTCYTPIVPMVFLAVKNNMTLLNAFNYYGEIELITVLTSCISIALAIPISLYTSAYILKPKEVRI